MDHILENEGKPVPDLGNVSESKSSSSNAMDVDEDDEDREALESRGIAKATDQEAKVESSNHVLALHP
jgi:UBX domain-containing protein 1/4